MPAEPGDSGDRIQYVLSFLGTTGHMRFKQWKPAGAIPHDCASDKKSAEGVFADQCNLPTDEEKEWHVQV